MTLSTSTPVTASSPSSSLANRRVAVIATDGFEETELTQPVQALKAAGARVDVISPKAGQIQAFRHHDRSIQVPVDRVLEEIQPGEYDAVMLPGGVINADALRVHPKLQMFLRAMHGQGKPIAAICHGAWSLISAGIVRDRKMTSYHTIQDDLKNAGAQWVDEKVVVDANWVTSRQPDDLPDFNREMVSLFGRRSRPVASQVAAA